MKLLSPVDLNAAAIVHIMRAYIGREPDISGSDACDVHRAGCAAMYAMSFSNPYGPSTTMLSYSSCRQALRDAGAAEMLSSMKQDYRTHIVDIIHALTNARLCVIEDGSDEDIELLQNFDRMVLRNSAQTGENANCYGVGLMN